MIQLHVDENEPIDWEPTPDADDIADIEAWINDTPDVPPAGGGWGPKHRSMGRFDMRDWAQWDAEHEGAGREAALAKFSSSEGLDARTLDALHEYTFHGNEAVNGVLRDPAGWAGHPYEAAAQKDIGLISGAMRPTPVDATTYRGMNVVCLSKMLGTDIHNPEDLQKLVGGTIHDAGFVSTSHSIDKSVGFTGSQAGAIFAIHVPEGTKAIDMSVHSGRADFKQEQELLLDKGTSFKVTSVEPGSDATTHGNPIVHVEVVQ